MHKLWNDEIDGTHRGKSNLKSQVDFGKKRSEQEKNDKKIDAFSEMFSFQRWIV